MFLRAAASIILSVSVLLGALPFGSFEVFEKDFTGGPDSLIDMKGDFKAASYDNYEITLADGETVAIYLLGASIDFESSVDRDYEVAIVKVENSRNVKTFYEGGESFSIELADYLDEDTLYYVILSYDCYGMTVNSGNNIVFMSNSKLYFWQSPNYEYNVLSTSEMWTDEQSLKECLQPQNDVECDDPVLIEYSNQICAEANNDWEKVFRIYMYIASEMAYDMEEASSAGGGYQDSAVDIIRDGKGICEGFANLFTALCRAQGIPACVEFGIGFADYDELTTRIPTSSDYADHAWAAVYVGDKWHFMDPTYDMAKYYNGPDDIDTYSITTLYYMLPLEAFSNDHMILDADTIHGLPSAGSCGTNATYEITRDNVLHISGYGMIQMPDGVNGFSQIVFEDGSDITEIGSNCFVDCDLLTVVYLPSSVKYIDTAAFNTCEDLQYIYLPEGLEYIGQEAFDYCDELSYVYVPDSVTDMGYWAFDDCPRLYLSVPSHLGDVTDEYELMPMYVEYR